MNAACALVGGQFGSEGKGLIAGKIAKEYGHHVRVGAANAGHTVYSMDVDPEPLGAMGPVFEKHVMQQVPCAAYANPDAHLYIGPGAQISPDIFREELVTLARWRERHGLKPLKVMVDSRAHVIQQVHINMEQRSKLADRIGSTSTIAKEGIGAAQASRVMRDETCVSAWDFYGPDSHNMSEALDHIELVDVPQRINSWPKVLLEGTQGTGLSLTTGPFPYTTSRNTTAAGLCADAGLAPTKLERVILVCRSYPIRVAGNSGPFHQGSREITWSEIGVDEENERTTVTKLVRRVATFSIEQVVEAAKLNGATEIALTFADYLEPTIAGGAGNWGFDELRRFPEVAKMASIIASATGVPVTFVGTGPHSVINLPA